MATSTPGEGGCVTTKDPVTGLNVTVCSSTAKCDDYKSKAAVIDDKIKVQERIDHDAKAAITASSKPKIDALKAEKAALDSANPGCSARHDGRNSRSSWIVGKRGSNK
jgi:hypothetical protein